jgi:hypothetical protein
MAHAVSTVSAPPMAEETVAAPARNVKGTWPETMAAVKTPLPWMYTNSTSRPCLRNKPPFLMTSMIPSDATGAA